MIVTRAEQQPYRVQQRCLAKFQHGDVVGQVQCVSDVPQVLHAAVLHIHHLPLPRGAGTEAQQLPQTDSNIWWSDATHQPALITDLCPHAHQF